MDAGAFQKWASGSLANTTNEDGDVLSDTEGSEPADAHDHCAIWAGDGPENPEEIQLEEAQKLIEWLESNEPVIHDAITELASAVVGDDSTLVQHAIEELGQAETQSEGYPNFDPEQRTILGEELQAELAAAGNPSEGSAEFTLAIAAAVDASRRGDANLEEEGDPEAEDDDDEAGAKPAFGAKKPPPGPPAKGGFGKKPGGFPPKKGGFGGPPKRAGMMPNQAKKGGFPQAQKKGGFAG